LDSRDLGRIQEWKGKPKLTMWTGEYCNVINGTDATIHHPFWSPKDKLYIFVVDACRWGIALLFNAVRTIYQEWRDG
jgi:hypothetical protein